MARRRVQWILLRVLVAALVIGFCIVFFRRIEWGKLRDAFWAARWSLLAIAAAVNFIHLLVRAIRWKVLLAPLGEVSTSRLFRYTIGGYAASNLFPARFGEVLRVFYLRPHGIPVAGAAGVQVLEKVYEVTSLLLLVAPLPLALPLPVAVSRTIGFLAAVGVVGAVLMVWMARRGRTEGKLLGRIGAGMAILRSPSKATLALALSLLVWLVDAIMVVLVLRAVHIDPSLSLALLALLFINVAIAVPSTPAQVGAFEAAGVFALQMVGIQKERALAFAFLYHFIQVIPVTLAGLEVLLLWRTLHKEKAASAEPVDPGAGQ